MRATLKALRSMYPLVCACVRNEVWKKKSSSYFLRAREKYYVFNKVSMERNDHFMDPKPDLDLGERVY